MRVNVKLREKYLYWIMRITSKELLTLRDNENYLYGLYTNSNQFVNIKIVDRFYLYMNLQFSLIL